MHYLDVDQRSTKLIADGSYIRAMDPEELQARPASRLSRRMCKRRSTAWRLPQNGVLHSGVDREHGHFIAAYGFETAERVGAG